MFEGFPITKMTARKQLTLCTCIRDELSQPCPCSCTLRMDAPAIGNEVPPRYSLPRFSFRTVMERPIETTGIAGLERTSWRFGSMKSSNLDATARSLAKMLTLDDPGGQECPESYYARAYCSLGESNKAQGA